jgi:putative ABC transport system permease protein
MSANLFEQSKEIGILRSLGVTTRQTYRLYFYEALILVFSGALLGTSIGTFLSFTMTLQYSSFVGMPTAFYFPIWHLLLIFLTSLLCALLSTFAPARSILQRPVAATLRS